MSGRPGPRSSARRRAPREGRDLHTVAVDVALLVGVAGAGLLAAVPRRRSREPPREVAQQEVEEHGIPRVRRVSGRLRAGRGRRPCARRARARACATRSRLGRRGRPAPGSGQRTGWPRPQHGCRGAARASWVRGQWSRRVVSSPHSTQSSICLVEWGSVKACPKKNSRKPRSRAPSSAGCTWPSPRSCRARRSKENPVGWGRRRDTKGGRRLDRHRAGGPAPGTWAALDGRRAPGEQPPTSTARSVAVASSTARASAANSRRRTPRARPAGRSRRSRGRRT